MTRTDANGTSFASRLLLAQALVLAAGAVTTWLVASVIGPGIFHRHLMEAHVGNTDAETRHVEEAFTSALLVSISVAVVAAIGAALVVSWYFSRRVRQSIGTVTDAASGIGAGRYDARVPDPGLGSEFHTLAATYNQLAQRLEDTESTRRQMLSDLAHEMRTPLATIEAHLEAVEDGVRQPDAATLEIIRGSTERLKLLAHDLGAVSRAEEGALSLRTRPTPVRSLVQAATDAARDRYDAAHVTLEVALESDLRVTVDPERIGQVLGNLLDNALRHTPAGGHVTLSCRDRDDRVEISVADTGDGIAPEHLDHVFERFYRTDTARSRDRGGSGIGLSIAKAIVDAHGGTIGVTSDGPGTGSRFTFTLPGSPEGVRP